MYDITFPVADRTGDEQPLADITKQDSIIANYGVSIEDIQALYLQVEKKLSPKVPVAVRERLQLSRSIATHGFFQWKFFTVATFWTLTVMEQALIFKFDEVTPQPRLLSKKKGAARREQEVRGSFSDLEKLLRQGWRLKNLPAFNGSFRGLMTWASNTRLIAPNTPLHMQDIRLPHENTFILKKFPSLLKKEGLSLPKNPTVEDVQNLWKSLPEKDKRRLYPTNAEILAEGIPNYRNELAHPGSSNQVQIGRSQVEAFMQAADLLGQLWPPET